MADTPTRSLTQKIHAELIAAGKMATAAPPKASSLSPTRFAERPKVSIVVTARNYGRFLRECLQSCLTQTEKSVEVIYSDDASDDDSLAVARSFSQVSIVANPNHSGVVSARNRGVAAARGDVLIHVDGDDMLPNNFVAKHLEALGPGVPFVYGPAQAFGDHCSFWDAPPWGKLPLAEQNYVNTSAAINRWAFEAAGGWQETPTDTGWDWNLFWRASRFGTPARSEAALLYRQHGASWSSTHERIGWPHAITLLGPMRRSLATLSIGCIYSGRLPELLPSWLDAICEGVSEAGLPEKPEFVILDNSANQADVLYRETGKRAGVFSCVQIVPWPAWQPAPTNEQERRDRVATYMAASSNAMLAKTRGDLVWLIEDDVVIPRGGFAAMFNRVADGYPLTAAVAGAYQNRHTNRGFVGGWFADGRPREIDELPGDLQPFSVDITGTGCLLFWRALAPQAFESHLAGEGGHMIPAHDWAFVNAIKRSGRNVLLMPGVRCRHFTTSMEWV